MAPATHTAGVPYGETSGAAVLVEDVLLSVGNDDLITGGSFQVERGQKWGLVGSNGCGKSTLMRCLAGRRAVDAGGIAISPRLEVGYLEQVAVSGSTATVYEEARSRMTRLVDAKEALDAAERDLADGEETSQALCDALEEFEAAGGYTAEKDIADVLDGLGFARSMWDARCDGLSGGWQMRVALARLLLSPAARGEDGLLLLDEPSNHLDAASKQWLSRWIAASPATAVLISHDEALLDAACTHVAEIRGKGLHTYTGGYSKFLNARDERARLAAATYAKQLEEKARLEDFVRRFSANASKATQAQSRQKQLDKLIAEMEANAGEAAGAAAAEGAAGDLKRVKLWLPEPPASDKVVLRLKGAELGYDASTPLLKGSLQLERGMRVAVLGPNGAGKSTLLKSLAGKLPLLGGKRLVGDRAEVGVFSQDLAQELPQGARALDHVLEAAWEHDAKTPEQAGRNALGALGLSGEMALRRVGDLSGGEKARVALAAFVMKPCNVLLADEPSNHLDRAAIVALTDGLQDWGGALFVVSHNRAFLDELQPTHVLRVADGSFALENFGGRFSEADFEHRATADATAAATAAAAAAASASAETWSSGEAEGEELSYAERKRLMKGKEKAERLLLQVEKHEAELEALDVEMAAAGNDLGTLTELQQKRAALEAKMDDALEEAERLEAEAAAAGV